MDVGLWGDGGCWGVGRGGVGVGIGGPFRGNRRISPVDFNHQVNQESPSIFLPKQPKRTCVDVGLWGDGGCWGVGRGGVGWA